MRIVSLLPSLTELVHALGRGDWLVGVTHECDYPPGVESLPHLTRNLIPLGADSATIDTLVSAHGGSIYAIDATLLESLKPDLILTQAQCDVCAVNEATVRSIAACLTVAPRVESVNPTTLGDVFAMFRHIGVLLDASDRAEKLIETFYETGRHLKDGQAGQPVKRLLLLEWVDPPYSSGHWNPEIIGLAGGIEPLAIAGQPSRRVTWEAIALADPDTILVAACGFDVGRTLEELESIMTSPEWLRLRAVRNGQVAITDGSAYFSRPGPRLEQSLCIAALALGTHKAEVDNQMIRWL